MMAEAFCDVPALGTISNRLGLVFPEGIDYRNYLTRDIAAKTVFVMFYAGAVEGSNNWIRPNQVTRMTDTQSRATGVDGRREWVRTSLQPGKAPLLLTVKQLTHRRGENIAQLPLLLTKKITAESIPVVFDHEVIVAALPKRTVCLMSLHIVRQHRVEQPDAQPARPVGQPAIEDPA